MQAVILAAGYGLRLRPFTEQHPKGLVPVSGKPLLVRTLESLPDNVNDIVIVTGWLGEQIEAAIGQDYHGKPITYVQQNPIDGTGSALVAAKPFLKEKFLVVNGDDIYSKDDLTRLCSEPWAMLATKTARPVPGALTVTEDGFVVGIDPDDSLKDKWQNCGAYTAGIDFFSLPLVGIPVRDKTEFSLPHTLVQDPARHRIRLVEATGWLPVGTPEELAKAEKILQNV
jgi:bifunctional UDP-N-acetylglucosamine pyrophosphorylase/glucosamine-1-phosphate N-acetyltransferase